MSAGKICLFGRFHAIAENGQTLAGLEARKVQELLSFLLLAGGRPVQRERLAEYLWPEIDGTRSKKYLRQALWQLQKVTDRMAGSPDRPLLLVDQDWIGTNPAADVWVDVIEFNRAYEQSVQAPPGRLEPGARAALRAAVALYRGELLEGWYCDWIALHQDIHRSIYLLMLDKLMVDAELGGEWELGLMYGRAALRLDRAKEGVHVRMMRLHCMAGDRTGALRQFQACADALRTDLEVEPETSTTTLYDEIRDKGHLCVEDSGGRRGVAIARGDGTTGPLRCLRDLDRRLRELQLDVAGHIRTIERS